MNATLLGSREQVTCRWCSVVIAMALLMLQGVTATAGPVTIDVKASDGTKVGTITVDVGTTPAPNPPGGTNSGITGGFTSTYGGPPPTLQAAAARCGEDHFNWFQGVLADNNPPNGPDGQPLTPPYIDPPPGGYGPPDTQWADSHPWYWDEEVPPDPKPEGYDPRYQLGANTTDDTLNYEDFPWGSSGTNLEFVTWLVSLNADGSLHSFHGGFTWTWTRNSDPVVNLLGPLSPGAGQQFYNQMMGIPEPTSCTLAVLGLVCLAMAGVARRRRVA